MMTVSNVINKKYDRVSQKTIDKVQAVIEKYHYVPNLTARSLTARSSHIIGCILTNQTGNYENIFENPYVSSMLGIIEHELRNNGYYVMIRVVKTYEEIASFLKNWNCDGALFFNPQNHEIIENLRHDFSMPLVFFDSNSSDPDILSVDTDDFHGGYLSARYLITHGHKKIAFLANPISPVIKNRFAGYKKALEEAAIPFDDSLLFPIQPIYDDGIRAGESIAADPRGITAIVTTADICAVGCMEGLRLGGMRIPGQISIVGYDNLSLCNYTYPKLTSISQNIPEKAHLGVELLLNRLKNISIAKPHLTTAVSLVERQSAISMTV
ncbi:MAG: LacI family transcriptional regulator [Robinsoniella sp.]|nr:LacI family transcriptional regulator [Robinsoniella sp.]